MNWNQRIHPIFTCGENKNVYELKFKRGIENFYKKIVYVCYKSGKIRKNLEIITKLFILIISKIINKKLTFKVSFKMSL